MKEEENRMTPRGEGSRSESGFWKAYSAVSRRVLFCVSEWESSLARVRQGEGSSVIITPLSGRGTMCSFSSTSLSLYGYVLCWNEEVPWPYRSLCGEVRLRTLPCAAFIRNRHPLRNGEPWRTIRGQCLVISALDLDTHLWTVRKLILEFFSPFQHR